MSGGEVVAVRMLASPIGALRLSASPRGIREIWIGPAPDGPARDAGAADAGTTDAAERWLDVLERSLTEFFAGQSAALDAPTDAGGTEFQRAVWDELMRIPAGQTRSYADVARAIGRPAAVRAVARANATNPLPIVVPCHRVIGSDGTLTGYGGGLDAKRWLLDHERKCWGAGLFAGV